MWNAVYVRKKLPECTVTSQIWRRTYLPVINKTKAHQARGPSQSRFQSSFSHQIKGHAWSIIGPSSKQGLNFFPVCSSGDSKNNSLRVEYTVKLTRLGLEIGLFSPWFKTSAGMKTQKIMFDAIREMNIKEKQVEGRFLCVLFQTKLLQSKIVWYTPWQMFCCLDYRPSAPGSGGQKLASQFLYVSFGFFFWSCLVACRILVPAQGANSMSPVMKVES